MPEKNRDIVFGGVTDLIQQKKRTNHLLIIGIDKYANGIPPLHNAVRDAEGFKKILLEQYQFDSKNCTFLINEAATRGNILETFTNLLNELTAEDNLIFCFSGHGTQLQKGKGSRGYWIPYDATLGKDWTYLPNEEITLLFRNSKAHHIFGIVDSCFSGSLFVNRTLNLNERKVSDFPSRWLLTAGRLEPVSDGSLGTNSPFATALLTILKENPQETIWADELCSWVLRNVSFNTQNQTPRGEPLQSVGHQGGQFIFRRKQDTQEKSQQSTQDDHSTPTKIERHTPIPPKVEENVSDLQQIQLKTIRRELKKNLSNDIGRFLPAFKTILTEGTIAFESINDLVTRYNQQYRKYSIRGTITSEQFLVEENKILQALKKIINQLVINDLIPSIQEKTTLYPLRPLKEKA